MRVHPESTMLDLQEVLSTSSRNYLMIAHRARSDDRIPLNDLCGASGRWDGVSRAITSALFLSHSMRRDTTIHILLLGPEDPPKLLSVNGERVKYLNPDERAGTALMKKCLSCSLSQERGAVVFPSPGITLARAGLEDIIESFQGGLMEMDEKGIELTPDLAGSLRGRPMMFILSDDQNLTNEEASIMERRPGQRFRVGDKVLHTHMAITIVHYLLDRAGI
ncbi:MAG: tRNA (pseudouridine(54)-N(1))-methyltransferase TrmY [Candidatus Thermoplasmatota archaeon]|nr:tRNA (pseudouridine(54)-N(1))-methyltransferase TrmY [Candidatus Thermoplasmatota archaeon]